MFQGCLDDPRVRLIQGDVGLQISTQASAFDAILLDVDNGPDGLVQPMNRQLYSMDGLAGVRQALRPGGVLAVWSASPAPRFEQRLRSSGFDVELETARSSGRKGAKHVIYLATPSIAEARLPVEKGEDRTGRRMSGRRF